jgi:hypothetical protein
MKKVARTAAKVTPLLVIQKLLGAQYDVDAEKLLAWLQFGSGDVTAQRGNRPDGLVPIVLLL